MVSTPNSTSAVPSSFCMLFPLPHYAPWDTLSPINMVIVPPVNDMPYLVTYYPLNGSPSVWVNLDYP